MLRSLLSAVAFVALCACVIPTSAVARPDAAKDSDTKKPSDLVKAGQVSGMLIAIDESKRTLKIKVEFPKLNPSAQQGLLQAQFDLQRATSPQAVYNARQAMAQHQANLYTKDSRDIDLSTVDEVKVRLMQPPTKFDEKGQIVKPGPKELKELKGTDASLPGYTGEFSDLRTGQVVAVHLVQRRDALKPKPVTLPKGKDADAEMLLNQQNQPQVSMVVVVGSPIQK